MLPPLIYGAIIDNRKREIPNIVPLLICGIGIIDSADCPEVLLRRFVVAAIILGSYMVASGVEGMARMGGGDIKLMAAMTIALGVFATAIVVFFTGLAAVVVSMIKYRGISKLKEAEIPMCTFVLPAYVITYAMAMLLPK